MGLTNLADWLGSNAAWFPLRPARGASFDRRTAAAAALAATGLDRSMIEPAGSDEAILARTLALYTEGKAAARRPAQARTPAALIGHPPVPGDVLVLEDETGGGKTLAAYLVHALLARRGLVAGITFCPPTRASAKAIHDGAVRVYGHRYPPILALPGYDEALTSPLPAGRVPEDDLPRAQRSRHRFLVSPAAVGTIDQVLLGTLTVPYAHLHACAIARNLLVVDEVHSSDRYMRGLLVQAVASHRCQGGITLLMSATLGSELRTQLLGAGTGVGRRMRHRCGDAGAAAAPPSGDAPYPVLWRRAEEPIALGDPGAPQKRVTLEPWPDWPLAAVDRMAEHAVAAAAGARVLVVRNTVALARSTMLSARDLGPDLLLHLGGHPVCHHARYAGPDRLALDEALRAALHPERRSGAGLIAITTQTAEQSLDIDADLLVTDLAPVDVLLQRIGRLHRNRSDAAAAARPKGFKEPRCIVLAPEAAVDLVRLAGPNRPKPNNWGTDRAYADVLALAKTRELIGAGGIWPIPAANRDLVEAVATSRSLEELAARLGSAGANALRHSLGKGFLDRELAGRGRFGFDAVRRAIFCATGSPPAATARR
jgi:CRISPR-associated endonuclease/helicase Cas3